MADHTASSIVVAADAARVMDVIADFQQYPQWAKGVTSAQVTVVGPHGRADEVDFVLEAAPIVDEYTLAYRWQADTAVTWSLVHARLLTSMDGSYTLRPQGAGTEVTYELSVGLSIPIIGMLRHKGERVIIDTALKGLKQRVESLAR